MSEPERGEWETSKERMRAHGGFGVIGELLMAPAPTLVLPVTPPLTAQVAPAPAPQVATPAPIAPVSVPPTVPTPVGWLDAKLHGLTTEPPPLVGKGIVPRRSTVHFGGGEKVGKTQRILQLAAEGACGLPVFGTFPVPCAFRTLLLEPELEWPTLNERIEGIVKALKLDRQRVNDNFHILPITQLNVLAADAQKQIAGWVKGFNLLILDSISSFHHCPNENDNAGMQDVANALRELSRTLDISILTTGHLRKPGPGEKHLDLSNAFDAIRGATSYRGAMDTLIVIQTGNHVNYDFFVKTRRPTHGTESSEEYAIGSLAPHWVLASGQHHYVQSTRAKARDTNMLAWIKQGQTAGTLPKKKEAVCQKAIDDGAVTGRTAARGALESLEQQGKIDWPNGELVVK